MYLFKPQEKVLIKERKIQGKREGGEDVSYELGLLENINNYIER